MIGEDLGVLVGVDAGGTRTRAVAISSDGRLLGRGVSGPGNLLSVGPERAEASIAEAVGNALGSDTTAIVGCIGAAGVDRPEARQQVEQMLIRGSSAARWVVQTDAAIALAAGTLGLPGVVVIAGTGSIAYGEDGAGRTARVGGWGGVLGDEGSAYDIGRQAIGLALRAHDGRGRATGLTRLVRERLGLASIVEVAGKVYGGGLDRSAIAALASVVAEAAEAGDDAARGIFLRAGDSLAELASAALWRIDRGERETPVVMAGGLWPVGQLLRRPFERALRRMAPGGTPTVGQLPPVGGAALLAARAAGLVLDNDTSVARLRAELSEVNEGGVGGVQHG